MNLVSIDSVQVWLVYVYRGSIGVSHLRHRVVLYLHDPGFLQTSGFSTGFANDKYTSAVSNASVGLATIWICVWWSQKYRADDASTTFSFILFRRKREEEMQKLANTVEIASFDVEMKWKWVMWEERRGEGRTTGMAIVNFAWIRACVKAGLAGWPYYSD